MSTSTPGHPGAQLACACMADRPELGETDASVGEECAAAAASARGLPPSPSPHCSLKLPLQWTCLFPRPPPAVSVTPGKARTLACQAEWSLLSGHGRHSRQESEQPGSVGIESSGMTVKRQPLLGEWRAILQLESQTDQACSAQEP